ncbi:MAG: hypothetical protein AAF515_21525 [Pseudomonadota bacterium]
MKHWTSLAVMALGCAACVAQPRLVDEPTRIEPAAPLAVAQDDQLEAILDWVIVPSGPGSWARNAQWDEYLLRVGNRGAMPLTIKDVLVIDSLDGGHEPQLSQDALLRASVATRRRYRDEDIDVRAGYGAPGLTRLASGVGVAGTAAGFYGEASGGFWLLTSSQSAAASVVGTVGVFAIYSLPAMLLIDASRREGKRKVALEMAGRVTPFQRTLAPGEAIPLDLFFPLAPAPQALELTYQLEGDTQPLRTLRLAVDRALDDLHLANAAPRALAGASTEAALP